MTRSALLDVMVVVLTENTFKNSTCDRPTVRTYVHTACLYRRLSPGQISDQSQSLNTEADCSRMGRFDTCDYPFGAGRCHVSLAEVGLEVRREGEKYSCPATEIVWGSVSKSMAVTLMGCCGSVALRAMQGQSLRYRSLQRGIQRGSRKDLRGPTTDCQV